MGSYTRNMPPTAAETDSFNQRIMDNLNGEEPDQSRFENWSAEQVREAALGFARADARKAVQKATADAFLAAHPEFVDSEKSALTMNKVLATLYGDRVYSIEEFETAYRVCLATPGTLDINEAVLVKQRQKEADRQRKAAQKAEPTLDELETMPLEDLRRLDAQAEHERKRRIAEEGGY